MESYPGWGEFALEGQTRGAGARDEFHRRRIAYYLRLVKQRSDPELWGELRTTYPLLLENTPTAGRRICWDEIDTTEMPLFGDTLVTELPAPPDFDIASGCLREEPLRQVSFVDSEGDGNSLKLFGDRMSWHDTHSDECFLASITRLVYQAEDNTIIAPENAELVCTVVDPSDSEALLMAITEMAVMAGVSIQGFPQVRQVHFTDQEGDGNTLKLFGRRISWHDTHTDQCLLASVTRLVYREEDNAIVAPEVDILVSRQAVPLEGDTASMLRDISDMAALAGVALEGFPE